MSNLPRQLEILRENFNADLRAAVRDGIDAGELIALAGAVAEDLIMGLPKHMRGIGVECVLDQFAERILERTANGE